MSTFSSANVTDGNLLLKERTHTINKKIQLHILGVPMNKLGNWLIVVIFVVSICASFLKYVLQKYAYVIIICFIPNYKHSPSIQTIC